ncbi:DUF4838 domain-containing protein [Paenibacillus agaridevorans]|nr:DUF4838 domain-containing protein [Paenibacillus agaridevorans]
MSKGLKSLVSLALSICMIVAAAVPFGSVAYAGASGESRGSDLSGHWSEPAMNKWIDLKLLSGYADGTFRPDRPTTRAEFVALLDRLFVFQEKEAHPFRDVPSDAWFANSVGKAYTAGIIQGIGDGRFEPGRNITREDAAVMVARAFQVDRTGTGGGGFKDDSQIASYAVDAISSLHAGGFIKGRNDLKFVPKGNITRAEVVQLLNNVSGDMARESKTLTGNVSGNLVVTAADVQLRDLVIEGNLFIAQGVAEGDLNLDNVMVKGNTYVWGGGENSIHIMDSLLAGNLYVNKWNSKIRILISGTTKIEQTILLSGAILEEAALSETFSGFENVDISMLDQLKARSVRLNGIFKQVRNLSAGASIELGIGTVIQTMLFDASANVVGEGKIEQAQFNANDVVVSMRPQSARFAKGISATIASKLVTESYEHTASSLISGGTGTPSTPQPQDPEPDDLPIVENGNPAARIIVAAGADAQTKAAAHKLVDYVKKSTGAELPLLVDDSTTDRVTAENGLVRMTFFVEPASIPQVTDFVVTPVVNDEPAASAVPAALLWDAMTKSAILTVPAIAVASVQQHISYRVAYQDHAVLESGVVVVEADAHQPINLNPSFDIGYAGEQDAKPWRYWYNNRTSAMSMVRSDEQAKSGSHSLKTSGVDLAWLNQEIALPRHGEFEYSAYMLAPQGSQTAGEVQLYVYALDAQGQLIPDGNGYYYGIIKGQSTPVVESDGQWMKLQAEGSIAQQYDGKPVKALQIGVEIKGFTAGEAAYLDDFQFVFKDLETAENAAQDNSPMPAAAAADTVATNTVDASTVTVNTQTDIYIGYEGMSEQKRTELLGGLEQEGFVIHQDNNRIAIAGPTALGTEFGVNEFLERYVGVRWLMPGDDWEDVPQHVSLFVNHGDQVLEEPGFPSRTFDGYLTNTPVREAWMRNIRLGERPEISHNMAELFPPSKYKDTHPEFYPPGAHLDDPHNPTFGWQPCFTAPGIVDEAITNIKAYFASHPESDSYALSINDTANFCEANPSHPNYPNKLNSLGEVDMSNIYFNWVNQVAAGVFTDYPDKKIGLLAYFNVYDPPTNLQLDPRIIVYITDERSSWNDPDMRSKGQQLTADWAATGATIAFYEYLYGGMYMVPRTFFHNMSEVYQFAAQSGVKAFYSESVVNFAEGPKAWLAGKLQWDPYQDVDDLLEEWYERAVGAAAAPELAAYYEIWERFWEQDIFQSAWYSKWKNAQPRTNYLPLYDDTYMMAVDLDDIAESRRLLEAVVDKAQTPAQKKRASDILHMFEYNEAAAISYPRNEDVEVPSNETEALALIHSVVQKMTLANKRMELIKQFSSDPVKQHSWSQSYGVGRLWSGITSKEQDAIVAWIKGGDGDGSAQLLLEDLAEHADLADIRDKARLMLILAKGNLTGPNLIRNPGFEEGFKDWDITYSTIDEITDDAHSGAKALRVNVSSREQGIYVPAGKAYVLKFFGKIAGSSGKKNLIGINYGGVPGVGTVSDLVTVTSTEYEQYVIPTVAPNEYTHATIVVYNDVGAGWVYVDNFELNELSTPEGESTILSLSATNGNVHATFNHAPAVTPTAADFTVRLLVDGVATVDAHPAQVAWNAATRTAVLTVPQIAATQSEQSFAYRIDYKNQASVDSQAVTVAGVPGAPLNKNASFEQGYNTGELALPWGFTAEPQATGAVMQRSSEQARTGSYSLKASGMHLAWPNMTVALPETGRYQLTAYILVPQQIQTNGTVKLYLYSKDANKELIPDGNGYYYGIFASEVVQASSSAGTWVQIKWEGDIPPSFAGTPVKNLEIGLELLGFASEEVVYMDDVQLIKVNES